MYVWVHINTCVYGYIYIYIHTHVYIYTQMYTCTCMSPIPLGFEQVNHVIRHIGRKVPLFQSVCPLSLSLSLSQSPSLSISLSVSLSVSVSLSLSLSLCLSVGLWLVRCKARAYHTRTHVGLVDSFRLCMSLHRTRIFRKYSACHRGPRLRCAAGDGL